MSGVMPLHWGFKVLSMKSKYTLLATLVLLVVGTVFAVASHTQRKHSPQNSNRVMLEYSSPQLKLGDYTSPAVAPILISLDRLLIPVGDTLYMLDSQNRIVWHYSFEPNIIRDVMVGPSGEIYVTASEALILVLNPLGKEIWRTGMSSGSASYGQIKNYADGFLVIVDMEAYRMKGSNSVDILEFWKDRKQQWRKPFPPGARLHVAGNRILAVTTTQDGREITEIR